MAKGQGYRVLLACNVVSQEIKVRFLDGAGASCVGQPLGVKFQ